MDEKVYEVILAVLGLLTAAAAGTFIFSRLKMKKKNKATNRVNQFGIGSVRNSANVTQNVGNDSNDDQRTRAN